MMVIMNNILLGAFKVSGYLTHNKPTLATCGKRSMSLRMGVTPSHLLLFKTSRHLRTKKYIQSGYKIANVRNHNINCKPFSQAARDVGLKAEKNFLDTMHASPQPGKIL